MTIIFGAQGVSPTLRGQPSNVLTLQGGQQYLIPPGTWDISLDAYSVLQEYDPISTVWRIATGDGGFMRYVNSDGVNRRVANITGCVAATQVTNAGSGYTSAPTVTDNGGATKVATYLAIIGGAVNTSVTVQNGGTGYTYQPQILFSAPASPGVQATGYATISAGVITSITVTNQGAGYTAAPTITVQNAPNDTTGKGGVATATLTGSGTITAVLVTDTGTPITSTTTVPTLTFTGGGGSGAAATALMCWTTTAYTVTSAGSGYVGNVLVTGLGGTPSTTLSSYTNPTIQENFVRSREALYGGAISATGITTAGQTLYMPGIFAGVPTGYVAGYTGISATSAALVSFTMGTARSTVTITPV